MLEVGSVLLGLDDVLDLLQGALLARLEGDAAGAFSWFVLQELNVVIHEFYVDGRGSRGVRSVWGSGHVVILCIQNCDSSRRIQDGFLGSVGTYSFLGLLVDEDDSLLVNRWNHADRLGVNQSTVTECAGVHQVVGLLQRTVCVVENIN